MRFRDDGRIRQLAAMLAAAVACVALYPEVVRAITSHGLRAAPGLPGSFGGNRAAFGFALFSLFTVASLSARKFIVIAVQLRDEDWRHAPDIALHRIAIAALMLTTFLGSAPDVGVMLLWGEASQPILSVARGIDRICDGLTIGPFMIATVALIRAEQLRLVPLDDFRREFDGVPARERAFFVVTPRREGLAENVRIIVAIAVLALGLAVWK